jgi:hypothetical protein
MPHSDASQGYSAALWESPQPALDSDWCRMMYSADDSGRGGVMGGVWCTRQATPEDRIALGGDGKNNPGE